MYAYSEAVKTNYSIIFYISIFKKVKYCSILSMSTFSYSHITSSVQCSSLQVWLEVLLQLAVVELRNLFFMYHDDPRISRIHTKINLNVTLSYGNGNVVRVLLNILKQEHHRLYLVLSRNSFASVNSSRILGIHCDQITQ